MSANLSVSRSTARAIRAPSGRPTLATATAADVPAIRAFLATVFGPGAAVEFRSSLEDPFYHRHDRLLLWQDARIIAHAHTTRRVMRFGSLSIAASGLACLAVGADARGQGHGLRMLRAAENRMACQGALVGLVRTTMPRFFAQNGWVPCGKDVSSEGDVRAILSAMLCHGVRRRRRHPKLHVRHWRRLEMPALERIYNQYLLDAYGALERTEPYWQWLVRRRAFDQFYVALEGPDLLEIEETTTPIVGYAVVRANHILELITAPDHRRAAVELLARACADTIEQGCHWLAWHGPAQDRLHRLFAWAGGRCVRQQPNHGEVSMARLLAPGELLRSLAPELQRRAAAAGVPERFELGLAVDHKKYLITVSPQGVDVATGRIGRVNLHLGTADFTRLLLGQFDWQQAPAAEGFGAATAAARQLGQALFPRVPFWRPPLDDALAQADGDD